MSSLTASVAASESSGAHRPMSISTSNMRPCVCVCACECACECACACACACACVPPSEGPTCRFAMCLGEFLGLGRAQRLNFVMRRWDLVFGGKGQWLADHRIMCPRYAPGWRHLERSRSYLWWSGIAYIGMITRWEVYGIWDLWCGLQGNIKPTKLNAPINATAENTDQSAKIMPPHHSHALQHVNSLTLFTV